MSTGGRSAKWGEREKEGKVNEAAVSGLLLWARAGPRRKS